MTNMPKAKLAREAQLAYSSLTTVTDHDYWHQREAHITTEMAIINLLKNNEPAQEIAAKAIQLIVDSLLLFEAHCEIEKAALTPIEAMPDCGRKAIRQLLA